MFARSQQARLLSILTLALILVTALVFSTSGPAFAATDASPAAQPGTTLAVVRSAGATLFDAAGTRVRDLPAGTRLTAHGRSPDNRWLQVTTRTGDAGWVSAAEVLAFGLSNLPRVADFQEPASPAEAATSSADAAALMATVNTTDAGLNVRGGPGLSYRVIARLASGQTVPVLARSQDGAWLQVPAQRGPGFGWISASLVELSGDAADLPVSEELSDLPDLVAVSASQPARTATGLSGTIVFQERSGGKIYAHDLTSGSTRPIANGSDPAISPDGQQVVFWRDEEGQHHLFTVNIGGGAEKRLLTRGEMLRAPAWSPDGQRIVFSRVIGKGRCRDVGYGICVPDVPPYSVMFPLVESDQWGLSSVDAQGGDFRDHPSALGAIAPNWGQQGIVYDAPAGIDLTNDRSDAENRPLLNDFRYHDPALQPGGNRVVFQSLEKDHWEIFTANSDGANVTALTRPASVLVAMPHNVAPVWSPDGQHILFLSNRSGDWSFWVMNADGSGQRQLPIDVPLTYAYQMEQVASWQ